jgi:phosphopantothenoylcysteine decarboxylase
VPSFGSDRGNVLYLIVCAAPPAQRSSETVTLLQSKGWDVCVVTTPAAAAWVDTAELQRLTRHSVRCAFRGPGEPEFAPRGDAVLVAPATFNTINQAAGGVNDTLALGLTNEALGSPSIALALVPWVNEALAGHPAYRPNLSTLTAAGAHDSSPDALDGQSFDAAVLKASDWLARASPSGGSGGR